MAIKTLQQVLETHEEIVHRFAQHKKTLDKRRPAGNLIVIRQKRALLTHLDERLDNARKTRAESLAQHDAAIARIELSQTTLREEIEADEKHLGGDGGLTPTRPTPTGPIRPGPDVDKPIVGSPIAGTPVLRVKGVGKEIGARLEAKNIHTASELAAMDAGEVASALSISRNRASSLIREAKKIT